MTLLAATDSLGSLIGIAVAIIIIAIGALILSMFFKTWLRAKLSNAPVSWGNLIGMFLRKVPFNRIVNARITAVKAGLPYTSEELEAHFLAGGDVENTVLSLIAADKAGIKLP